MTTELAFAFGGPPLQGRIRATPEDFFVDEIIGFSATGSGEHWLLHIEKKGANTAWAVKRVAAFAVGLLGGVFGIIVVWFSPVRFIRDAPLAPTHAMPGDEMPITE